MNQTLLSLNSSLDDLARFDGMRNFEICHKIKILLKATMPQRL